MKELTGKTITAIHMTTDNSYLRFTAGEEVITYYAEGD